MDSFARLLSSLEQIRFETPQPWGLFHICCLAITFGLIAFFVVKKRQGVKINPNTVFACYAWPTLFFEVLKQLMWAVSVDGGQIIWSYSWYSAPFQFCTMPLYICLSLCFIKHEGIRKRLMGFLAYFSILSMVAVSLYPNTVFTDNPLICIHTMLLHCGGLVVAMFIIINKLVDFDRATVRRAYLIYIVFVCMALLLNVGVENSGINQGNTFNMFYISPYYKCELPVFSWIYEIAPYPIFLLSYLLAFYLGGFAVLGIIKLCQRAYAFVIAAKGDPAAAKIKREVRAKAADELREEAEAADESRADAEGSAVED